MVLEGSADAGTPGSLGLRQGPPKAPRILPAPPPDTLLLGKEPVKYGELIVLGYNGSLASGDKGRRRSRLALSRRPQANGVKPDVVHHISTPLVSKALSNRGQHSISYTLSRSHSVIVEYTHDNDTDMFQIGRSTENMIDFVVTDTTPGGVAGEGPAAQSTISRYACRVICERWPPYTARIYAAGFDASSNIFLGEEAAPELGFEEQQEFKWERAAKWRTPDGLMDGLTTNGVLVMHPAGGFSEGSLPGVWREISVCGNVYTLRDSRSAQQRGKLVENESNVLRDGSLIDLCGATLLWRTPAGLLRAPTLKQLEAQRQEANAARPQCPVGLSTLAFPSPARGRDIPDKQQPWVALGQSSSHPSLVPTLESISRSSEHIIIISLCV
ncbi:E3 ubiquitin-protein ligase pellino homolog 3 isoform X4 [Macrotis lagotis]|uniref:E3 ubiquitin-protein ligase pellino homolog 3 isoform X4 n=1 Tax=Macrotis lagotis TaxID=92651 RepID=UPI003D6965C7